MSLRTSASLIVLVSLVGCNSAPGIPEVSIEPDAPNTADDLVAKPVSTDDNGDEITYEYAWFKDGAKVPDLTGATVPAARTARGDSWRVEVIARDAAAASPAASAAVEIVNAPPTATVTITPAGATAGDDLVAAVVGDDADGDVVEWSYAWTRDGVPSDVVTDTIPANLTSVGETWSVTATPRDADGPGEPATASVDLNNGPPEIRGITFTPSPVTAANDVVAVPDVVDEDGDPLTYTWSWRVGTVDSSATTEVLPASEISRGDVVFVSMTVSDGTSSVGPYHEMVTVSNATPSVDGVELSPILAYETTTLSCTPLDPRDADGDSYTLSYAWTVNGTRVSGTTGSLTGDAFNRGDQVSCTVTARDATATGVYPSGTLTILNSAPVITSAALADSSPQTGDTLSLALVGPVDADGDDVSLAYEWYVGGVLAGTTDTLPPSAFAAGQVVYAIVTPSDDAVSGAPVRTSSIVIRNGRPVVSGVNFAPARPTDDQDLIATPVATDPESDPITLAYAWKVNNVTVNGATTDHLASSKFVRGDTVTVTVTPSDAGGMGAPYAGSTTIENALPTLGAAVLTPTPFDERSTLTCNGTGWYDPDGDGPPAYDIAWYVNDVKQGSRSTLNGTSYNRGDRVRCALMPFDGREFGGIVDSATVTASNAAPTIASVLVSDSTPRTGDTLIATVSGLSDPDIADAGSLSATLEWWVNDTLVSHTDTLAAGSFTRGDTVYAVAVPWDGYNEGTPVLSAALTVGNTPPVLTSASLSPTVVRTNDTLFANALASDVDQDPLTYSYAWKVNNNPVLSGASNRLTGGYFSKGDKVTATVTVSDGTASSGSITTSSVTVLNSVPTAPSVTVSPRWARPGVDSLRCTLVTTATDADLDTITYRMTWTRNGLPHVAGGSYIGPTQTTWPGDTIPASDLTSGETWVCTATASDLTAAGGTATASARAASLDLIAMDAGTDFTCGLTATGEARCWGYNVAKQSQPPAGVFASIAVGPDGACALSAAGGISCWGNVPTALAGTWKQVGVGDVHACGLTTNGSISCWGTSLLGNLAAPSGTWSSMSVGSYHACALNASGTAACWGANDQGQATPPSGATFVEVVAGGSYSCGRHADGTLQCWGDTLLATPPSGAYTSLVAGSQHACALDAADQLHCWGSPGVDLTAPTGSYAVVAPGVTHTCAVRTTGAVVCWGQDDQQQLTPSTTIFDDVSPGWSHTCGVDNQGVVSCWGDDTLGSASPPVITDGLLAVSGQYHGCALHQDGAITCWGDNTYGQRNAPSGTGFTHIEAGRNFTCAIDSAQALHCWGETSGTTAPTTGSWTTVSAGSHHACAVDELGALACWGSNEAGELLVPIGTWEAVTAGHQHTCGVHTDGTLQCWGVNTYNQTNAPGGSDFVDVSAGVDHTCALRSIGSIACWGNNLYNRATAPTGVYTRLSAGNFHSCATLSTGRAVCWGLYGL